MTYADVDKSLGLGYALDNLFLCLAAVLVIFMQPGFALVETGLNASKNAVNILFKNVIDLCIGVVLYFIVGYGLMYPGSISTDPATADSWIVDGFLGFAQVGIAEAPEGDMAKKIQENGGAAYLLYPQVDFLFQVAFAATAATIVSGAVAGRMKFSAYLIYTIIITAILYPICGSWKWGGGWLADGTGTVGVTKWFGSPFHDFAGSLVVHACGGFAGLAGAIALGPRMGRFSADGKPQAMPGHNLSLCTLGVLILWTGWYGFNPGSNLIFANPGATNTTMQIATNTTLAGGAGGVVGMFLSWILFKKPDLTMALNGILGGLVGITANCDQVTNMESLLIGGVSGVITTFGVILLDKLRIDDPVGAFPVHGLCGMWAGLAIIFFGDATKTLEDGSVVSNVAWQSQVIGTLTFPICSFIVMMAVFLVLKAMGVLRVSPEEESRGLDISEHGMTAYGTLSA